MQFARYHALGNVYVVLPDAPSLSAQQAQRLCDDRFGLAADGLLLPDKRSSAEFSLSIIKPDLASWIIAA